MTTALCCYSILRQGQGKKNSELWSLISNLYHGKASTTSHIKLLANVSYCFKDIYDETTDTEVDTGVLHSSQQSVKKHLLKSSLSCDDYRVYIAGIDITAASDLEKNNRTRSLLLISGSQLLELTKKGTAFYCKILAFASRKYDLEKIEY